MIIKVIMTLIVSIMIHFFFFKLINWLNNNAPWIDPLSFLKRVGYCIITGLTIYNMTFDEEFIKYLNAFIVIISLLEAQSNNSPIKECKSESPKNIANMKKRPQKKRKIKRHQLVL